MSGSAPTLIGHVGAVNGSTVSIRQSPTVDSGIAMIGGKSYRIGQVGSFVRIPLGYHDMYGVVSEVGANAVPTGLARGDDYSSERWMRAQLVGEIAGTAFERGISQYPNVGDAVHLVTEENLVQIYGAADSGQVVIGRLASSEGIPVRIDIDKLVTRHAAVLGSTGSGKSTTVASLLRSIVVGDSGSPSPFPNARILLLDIHGEYGRALSGVSEVFRINPGPTEQPLFIPYWALEITDLTRFLLGALDDKPLSQILDRILDYKRARVTASPIPGVDLTSMTFDSPVPFSLKKLWLELLEPEVKTWDDTGRTVPALLAAGDANTLLAPKYKPHSTGNSAPFINMVGVLGIRRPLDQMRSRLLDKQFDFLLHPGPWEPDLAGNCSKDLHDLLQIWLGHSKPITILDLSGIPSAVLLRLIGGILRIIYEGLFWGRDKSEGGIARPLVIAMEEAHRYLSKDTDGLARSMVQRIVKEGRKFGIGAMIVSQRPTEVDETILSQCGTFIALRMSNSNDRAKVQGALPDNLSGIVDSLSVLRTGEAIITGEAARLPIRCRISLPAEESRPNSEDPEVAKRWHSNKIAEDYGRVSASWRSQNSRWTKARVPRTQLPKEEVEAMEREAVASSTIVSIGYDAATETLEVEYKNGGVYQYFNVPAVLHQQLMESGSKGQFMHANIRNSFPYSRV